MIRQNLSTRPFYNTSTVRLWLGVAMFLVVAATVFNVERLVHYSRSDTGHATQASNDERRAVELRSEAARLRSSVDTAQVEAISTDAHEANDLIDRRTFSWTALFNRFESTLPPNVRITSMRRSIEPRGPVLSISVVARGVDDIRDFIEALDSDGAFSEVLPTDEQVNPDSGDLTAVLIMLYHPDGAGPTSDPKAVVP